MRWIHSYCLEGRNFWDVRVKANVRWSWRKLIDIREDIRKNFVSKIGDGRSTSAWFDYWCELGPLHYIVSNRDIMHVGWNINSRVADLLGPNGWLWPRDWLVKYPI